MNRLIIIIAFIALLLISCDDTFTNDDIDNKNIPDKNVSYSNHIQPLINLKCGLSGCHSYETGNNLVTYSDLMKKVQPYNPEGSPLYLSITGQSFNIMPPIGYASLTKNQIDGIKIWIIEGAKNN